MSNAEANEKFLRMDNLSPAVKNLQYAVRGRIVIRAAEIEKEIKQVSSQQIERILANNCDENRMMWYKGSQEAVRSNHESKYWRLPSYRSKADNFLETGYSSVRLARADG